MVVGCLLLTLTLPENDSLKGKRTVVKRVVERVRHKFQVAIAEVETQDDWKVATVGVTCVSNSAAQTSAVLNKVLAFIEGLNLDAEISDVQSETVRVF